MQCQSTSTLDPSSMQSSRTIMQSCLGYDFPGSNLMVIRRGLRVIREARQRPVTCTRAGKLLFWCTRKYPFGAPVKCPAGLPPIGPWSSRDLLAGPQRPGRWHSPQVAPAGPKKHQRAKHFFKAVQKKTKHETSQIEPEGPKKRFCSPRKVRG